MTGDKVARFLAGLAVLAVALVAGWVSFGHIAMLAAAHGYNSATAHMLPVSVDGLILASSMALLTGSAPWLSRAGLILGILATLAANVAAGAEFGIVGGVVNAWPAIAFIVASEILLKMIRATRDLPRAELDSATEVPTAPVSTPETVADAMPVAVVEDVSEVEPACTVPPVPVAVPKAVASGRAPRRAQAGKAKSPEKVFAAEIERGELPSLREVKRRAACGTERARVLRDQLAEILQEAPEAA